MKVNCLKNTFKLGVGEKKSLNSKKGSAVRVLFHGFRPGLHFTLQKGKLENQLCIALYGEGKEIQQVTSNSRYMLEKNTGSMSSSY